MRSMFLMCLVLSCTATAQLTFAPARAVDGLQEFTQVVDVDEDGVVDLVTASKSSLGVKFGVGDGSFGSATPLPDRAGPFVLADFDGDGALDLVHANPIPGPQSFSFSRGLGGVSFDEPVPLFLPSGALTGGVAAFDVEGDGDLDVVYAVTQSLTLGRLWLARNFGEGRFEAVFVASTGGILGTPFQTGDLDGDGLDDIVWTASSSPSRYVLATGLGDFGAARPLPVVGEEVADLVGDARAEVIGRADGRVLAYTLEADGFAKVVDAESPVELFRLNAIDVDGDGRRELVTTTNFSFPAGVVLRVTTPWSVEVAGWFQSSGGAVQLGADVDRDGRTDIVSAPYLPPVSPLNVSLNRTYTDGQPFTDLGGTLSAFETVPLAVYAGAPGVGGALSVSLGGAPAGGAGFLVAGFAEASLPLGGGTLVPSLDAVIGPFVVPPIEVGEQFTLSAADVDLLGVDVFVQWWFVGDGELSASSAVRVDG